MLLMETRISKRVGLNRPKGQLGGSCCPLTSRKLAKSEKHAHWPRKWLENLEIQNAVVGELYDIPRCGLFGCDEKAKISGKPLEMRGMREDYESCRGIAFLDMIRW